MEGLPKGTRTVWSQEFGVLDFPQTPDTKPQTIIFRFPGYESVALTRLSYLGIGLIISLNEY